MYDVIVIGAGIAGLASAVTSHERGLKTAVLYKKNRDDNNSFKAQGGVSIPVLEEDSVQSHFEDTLDAGKKLNDIKNTRILIESAQDILVWLKEKGIVFNPVPTREAAHSYDRVLHIGDITGREIHKGLFKYINEKCPGIEFIQGSACDFIKEDNGSVNSIIYFNEYNDLRTLFSKDFVIATGGIGGLFSSTSNSALLTGDGIALAWRAGLDLCDMEFIQFHPTVFCGGKKFFLISESLRGEGGKIIDHKGNEFLSKYHEKAELAPRDVVSLAITDYMEKEDISNVFLDVRHLGRKYLMERFPNIYNYCFDEGYDIAEKPVPVRPACHYFIGGIKVDQNSKTSTENIFACGECACSGVHGANRLASNSLLECLVYGILAGKSIKKNNNIMNIFKKNIVTQKYDIDIFKKIDELKENNERYIGIKRDEKGIMNLLDFIKKENIYQKLPQDQDNLSLMNMYKVSELIAKSALFRKKSIGVHKRLDSDNSENPFFHIIINREHLVSKNL